MSEKRIVPSNLMSWPRIKNLLPDQKLIIYHLWATATSAAGCWLLDSAGCAAALSLKEEALADALDEFERRQLVKIDKETGEIFILDWFRWHTFKTAARQDLLQNDIKKIQSTSLQKIIAEAAKSHLPEKTDTCAPREDKRSKEKKREEEPQAAPAALSSADLEKRLEALRAHGARVKDANLESDRQKIDELRRLADKAGIEALLNAISTENYPAGALKAALSAGLESFAAEKEKRRLANMRAMVANKTLQSVNNGSVYIVDALGEKANASNGGILIVDKDFLDAFEQGKLVEKKAA